MSVTGSELSLKIRQLLPDNSYKLSSNLLNDTCDNPPVQPFFKWFCDNVGIENILLKEEVQLKKRLQETGVWLTGDELDAALDSAIEDCPELLQLVQIDRPSDSEILKTYETEKEAYDSDINDIKILEESLKELTDLEAKLEEELEAEETNLEKFRIEEDKIYTDCSSLVDEFDSACHEAYEDVENLVRVYANAAERKGPAVAWTQVPLDLFIKHTETYNNYLKYHVNREFKGMKNDGLSMSNSDDFADENLSGKSSNDWAHELVHCQNNLITSTLDEIEARKELNGYKALAAHTMEIYNNGFPKFPQSVAQLQVEMAELISRRDTLEETNLLMETGLQEAVNYYGKYIVTEILVKNGQARLERKKKRLSMIEKLLNFACDMGHAHSDLLSILMQLQLRKFNEIVEFTGDIRHHFATEDSEASKRCEFMQKEQEKYNSIMTGLSCKKNIYNELFSSLFLGTDKHDDPLSLSTKKYDELLMENRKMKAEILGIDLEKRIEMLIPLEKDVMVLYDHETSEGPTKCFKLMPYKVSSQLEEVTRSVETAQSSVNEARKKFKDIMMRTANASLEREIVILWQRFLSDPETLKAKYDEAQRIVNRSHFVNSLES